VDSTYSVTIQYITVSGQSGPLKI